MAKHDRFRKEIEEADRRITGYVNRLEQLFESWLFDLVEQLIPGNEEVNAFILSSMSNPDAFPPELRDAVDNVLELYAEELSNIKGRFRIVEEDVTLTEEIAEIQANNIISELNATATTVASTLKFTLMSGAVLSARDIREQHLKSKFRQLDTGLVTDSAAYRSAFEIRKAEAVEEKPRYTYVGPRDGKNRPFCRFVLDTKRLWTLDEIKAELDTHPDVQLLPTFIYGGGYNCRHRWIFTKRR